MEQMEVDNDDLLVTTPTATDLTILAEPLKSAWNIIVKSLTYDKRITSAASTLIMPVYAASTDVSGTVDEDPATFQHVRL